MKHSRTTLSSMELSYHNDFSKQPPMKTFNSTSSYKKGCYGYKQHAQTHDCDQQVIEDRVTEEIPCEIYGRGAGDRGGAAGGGAMGGASGISGGGIGGAVGIAGGVTIPERMGMSGGMGMPGGMGMSGGMSGGGVMSGGMGMPGGVGMSGGMPSGVGMSGGMSMAGPSGIAGGITSGMAGACGTLTIRGNSARNSTTIVDPQQRSISMDF